MSRQIQIAISLVLLVAMIYVVRSVRGIHRKINKVSSQNRDIEKSIKASNKEMWQHYRQGEYFAQLISLMKFNAPLPPTRSWAASPDLLLTLMDLVRKNRPKLVVELGSGISTLIMAKASQGQIKIVSIDHSEEFAQKTREMLKEHGVKNVEIRVAPLKKHASGSDWYDLTFLKNLKNIDLLVIDGPPGSKNPKARQPALKEFEAKLSPKAVIVIDDVNRDGERELAEMFAKAFPKKNLEILPHEKGSAVIC
jgi:predicted O-methyltransferase YrrM